jgi:hypothetical protein
MSILRIEQITNPLDITGSLYGTASYATTASYAMNGGGGGTSVILINSSSIISGIEIADFDNNVSTTFVGGTLKFIFGTPTVPSAPTLSFNNTFLTDRFNRVTDNYDLSGSITVNGYTLVSASLYTGSVLLAQIGTGTTLRTNLTTSGSQVYRLEVTASSPLDGTFNYQTASLTGTLSKIAPTIPSISSTVNVQLGGSGNLIEQGATGSISFSSAYGSSNGYTQVSLVNSPTTSPIYVTGSATGSSNVTIIATATYTSPGTDNVPTLTPSVQSFITYSKIRSIRYGASSAVGYTQAQLTNLALWDTSLGGTVGTIAKGTTYPYGFQFTVSTSGNYIYIVIDASYVLTGILNVNNSYSNDLNVFNDTLVGGIYRVYRSNAVSATTILYELRV